MRTGLLPIAFLNRAGAALAQVGIGRVCAHIGFDEPATGALTLAERCYRHTYQLVRAIHNDLESGVSGQLQGELPAASPIETRTRVS